MAIQDVTRVLANPRFQVYFDVLRPSQSTDDRGDAIDTSQTFTRLRGVIYPSKARTLQRTANSEKQVASIDIVSKFRLSIGTEPGGTSGEAPGTDADIVIWQNARWTVISSNPFTNYGTGFLVATADLLDYVAETVP